MAFHLPALGASHRCRKSEKKLFHLYCILQGSDQILVLSLFSFKLINLTTLFKKTMLTCSYFTLLCSVVIYLSYIPKARLVAKNGGISVVLSKEDCLNRYTKEIASECIFTRLFKQYVVNGLSATFLLPSLDKKGLWQQNVTLLVSSENVRMHFSDLIGSFKSAFDDVAI